MYGKVELGNVPTTFTITFVIFFLLITTVVSDFQIPCSRTCVAINCDSVGIRYGKYCGVGHSGCAGEKPCDPLDACCKFHDDCVGKHGITNIKCHKEFQKCIKRVQKTGKFGFTKDCPYDVAVPTMVQGIDLAILMSQLAGSKLEL